MATTPLPILFWVTLILSTFSLTCSDAASLSLKDVAFLLKEMNFQRAVSPGSNIKPLEWDSILEERAQAQTCTFGPQIVSFQGDTAANAIQHEGFLKKFVQTLRSGKEARELRKTYLDLSKGDAVGVNIRSNYSQIVWAKSKNVGCAISVCNSGVYGIACVLDPVGNIPGEKAFTYGTRSISLEEKVIVYSCILALGIFVAFRFGGRKVCRSGPKLTHSDYTQELEDSQARGNEALEPNAPVKASQNVSLKKSVILEFTSTAPTRLQNIQKTCKVSAKAPRIDIAIV